MNPSRARRYVEATTLLTTVAASRSREILQSLGRVPSDTFGLTVGAFPSLFRDAGRRVGSCVAKATTSSGTTLRSVADQLGHLRQG